jgi:carboxylesterase type B
MVQVRFNDGVVEGEVLQSEFGDDYNSFKGIPYAEPPIGELRFKVYKLNDLFTHYTRGRGFDSRTVPMST